MAHEVESMFYANRVKPWHGLGIELDAPPTSADAIRYAGLDWKVVSKKVYTEDGNKVDGYYANVRETDNKALGIVGSRYSIVQNEDAFNFTDALLGEGVTYETAGSLKDGRTIWLLAKLPNKYEILGDKVDPYIVFTNTHDGSGAVKVAMTPIRVVCNNTLNMALHEAKRTWSTVHRGNIQDRLKQAHETLQFAEEYMKAMKNEFEKLHEIKVNEFIVKRMIADIIPITEDMQEQKKENQNIIRSDIWNRYWNAPDLKDTDETGARLIQAVSDTSYHIEPFRRTATTDENRWKKAIEGNVMLSKALEVVKSA